MQSLRDKLLKAGLVTEEQAKKVETEAARKKERPPREAHPPQAPRPREEKNAVFIAARPQPRSEMAVPKLPPLPGSKAHQRIESKKQVELDRQLRELATTNQIAVEAGAHVFYFVTRKGRLRRIEMSDAQAALLEGGQLAVVERPEPAQIEHSLVPPEIAEKMAAISPKAVRFLNKPGAAIGFISDEELKSRQEAEARGEEPVGDDDARSGEAEPAGEDVPSPIEG